MEGQLYFGQGRRRLELYHAVFADVYCDDPAALCALPVRNLTNTAPAITIQEFDSDGLVQPYGDSPMDNQRVGENVYLNLIYGAKDYLYITTLT